jgi:hypothetical protein
MNATIRDNIVFSYEYDEAFYNLVLDACALRQDLALMPQGDMTEVGEKGITLSGGQRARISLARAVYARADLYVSRHSLRRRSPTDPALVSFWTTFLLLSTLTSPDTSSVSFS